MMFLVHQSHQQSSCNLEAVQQLTARGYEKWPSADKYYRLYTGEKNHLAARLTGQEAGARLASIATSEDLLAAKHYYDQSWYQ